MKLIVGLGNPGRRYESTRHNIGFKVVRVLADKWKIKLNSKAFQSLIGKGKIYGEEVIVALPQNFMNNSGEAVAALCTRKRVHLKDLLVICDDVNLSLGIIRIRARGSSGGHRGLDSIIEHLDAKEFSRLRIGIEKKGLKEGLSDYVLSSFNKNEVKILDDVLESAVKCCEIWIRQGTERAAHRFNVKNRKD
ncbi:MAG: hypothetical protein AMJ78_02165 [Omnitrophica WOR_2 bacterium SM23_29]|nr:MAG: hypothetical protein AMJ78_02165 [Omnitrophica WOR_2 bacterium SM23_29]